MFQSLSSPNEPLANDTPKELRNQWYPSEPSEKPVDTDGTPNDPQWTLMYQINPSNALLIK